MQRGFGRSQVDALDLFHPCHDLTVGKAAVDANEGVDAVEVEDAGG